MVVGNTTNTNRGENTMTIKQIDLNIGNPIRVTSRLNGDTITPIVLSKRVRSTVYFYQLNFPKLGEGHCHRDELTLVE